MTGFEIFMMIALLIMGVFLIVAMLLQKGSGELSGTIAGGSQQTYYGKDGKARAGRVLTILTTVISIVFVLIVVIAYVIQPNYGDLLQGNEWQNFSEYYSEM